MLPAAPHIRLYRSDDLAALYEICLRTGASGRDATDLVEDPKLFGDLYAAPYGVLESEHAFVLDDGAGRAVGYVVGAVDTAAFEGRCEAGWWPAVRERHPLRPDGATLDDLLVYLVHHRSLPPAALLAEFPAHLHINLLPQVQSGGWGRRLMGTLFDSLRSDGAAGVHWGVSTHNEPAIGFYRHLGYEELAGDELTLTFAQRL